MPVYCLLNQQKPMGERNAHQLCAMPGHSSGHCHNHDNGLDHVDEHGHDHDREKVVLTIAVNMVATMVLTWDAESSQSARIWLFKRKPKNKSSTISKRSNT